VPFYTLDRMLVGSLANLDSAVALNLFRLFR